jgi:photosystem II stability/assembly factor-like uncharacterized protein
MKARRRRLIYAVVALIVPVATCLSVVVYGINHGVPTRSQPLGTSANGAAAAASSPLTSHGGTLTDTTFGVGTEVNSIAMVSAKLGFGIASGLTKGRNSYFLVQTTDLGKRWSVRGALPLPGFRGVYAPNEPNLDFVNARVGYTSVVGGSLFVTRDGGVRWSKVSTPGIAPTYAISGSTLTAVSDLCVAHDLADSPLRCPSDLSIYRVGALTPVRSEVVPTIATGAWRGATELSEISRSTVVVAEGDRNGGPSLLLATKNAGVTWRRLSDPCPGLTPYQLLAPSSRHWLLYCFGNAAAQQGTSALWTTSNQGTTWSVAAYASLVSKRRANDIADEMNVLTLSGNKQILFGTMDGGYGGVETSTDGGVNWKPSNIAVNGLAGTLATFGSTSAILDEVGTPTYRTENGTTWTELGELPAGSYQGLGICTSANNITVALAKSETGIPASTLNVPIVFTNQGPTPCYLNGTPNFQPLAKDRRAVSAVNVTNPVDGEGPFVRLAAHGGRASVWFNVESVPSSYCVSKTMSGLSVRFARPSTFHVRTPSWKFCPSYSTISISRVNSGVRTWE